ncbi:MAG: peptidoglycan-binding protein [Pelagimonas sp.]|jgi:peptidoglycan hydrolase-like protein with peptidoglycan-binding domain|nr:peptidoglycan-binding protein [Pelagimonas sp.]
MRILKHVIAGVLMASPVFAAGDALVIGNGRFGTLQTLLGATRVADAAQNMQRKGVDVTIARDADAGVMRTAFQTFVEAAEDPDGPVIVVLSGTFMHSAQGSYLLPVDTGDSLNEPRILTEGLSLGVVLSVLAQHPGRAVLVLGETSADPSTGKILKPGVGTPVLPEGVAVVRGPASDVARFVARDLLSDIPLNKAAAKYELALTGSVPADMVVMRTEDLQNLPDPSTLDIDPGPDNDAWAQAQAGDSLDSYQAYLDIFPEGLHAGAAQQRVSAIKSEPFYQERRVEEALNLTRDARREIQRDLTILGHDTRGIDGIFGKGTRAGIREWQANSGFDKSGYLDATQVAHLDRVAAEKAAELEAEAERRIAEEKAAEKALWAQVRADPDEPILRKYLERFPDGPNAPEARRLVTQIDQQRASRAANRDRSDWRQADAVDSIAGYQRYLKRWPQGAFAAEARARIRDIELDYSIARSAEQAKREESRLQLNPTARKLAEARLNQIGFPAGPADGNFTRQTRAAIQDFQKTRGLRISGFLDEQTVVRLLADGILR